MREIKKALNKWRDTPCSWIGGLDKMPVLFKLICRFSTFLNKITSFFFFLVEIGRLILKFTWKCKGSRIILKKKIKAGEHLLSEFQISFNA